MHAESVKWADILVDPDRSSVRSFFRLVVYQPLILLPNGNVGGKREARVIRPEAVIPGVVVRERGLDRMLQPLAALQESVKFFAGRPGPHPRTGFSEVVVISWKWIRPASVMSRVRGGLIGGAQFLQIEVVG